MHDQFINALWPEGIDGVLCLFRIMPDDSNTSTWIRGADDITPDLLTGANVYLSAGQLSKPADEFTRGKAEDVVAVPGLWVDIDIADDKAHKKTDLPPTFAHAIELVNEMGLHPSMIVNSGHGLHAYWIFEEPFTIESDKDRRDIADLLRAWNVTMKAVCRKRGWGCDNVGDLARIMRLPGTQNIKGKTPVDCTIHSMFDHRYQPESFEPFLVAEEYEEQTESAIVQVQHITLKPDAPLPARLANDIAIDPELQELWTKKRKLDDTSTSAWDMALANKLCDGSGLTDQEIADTIIAFRRHHQHDLKKPMRLNYMQRTIGKARLLEGKRQAVQSIHRRAEMTGVAPQADDETRRRILDDIEQVLGVRIERWIQQGTDADEAVYYLQVPGQHDLIKIGRVDCVMSQAKFRNAMYVHTGMLIMVAKDDWTKIVALLPRVIEVVQIEETTRAGKLGDLLGEYLADVPPIERSSEAIRQRRPFTHDGRLWVHATSMRRHLITTQRMRHGAGFYADLHASGFASKKHRIGEDQANYYGVPMDSGVLETAGVKLMGAKA